MNTDDMVLVFGSNLAGRHGAGAALWAKEHRGAIQGQGWGQFGQSYALPTKNKHIQTLELNVIRNFVENFITWAEHHPEYTYQVTAIGCGLAGYKPEDIAPLFIQAPSNCLFDTLWEPILGTNKQYWGTL